MTRDEDKKIAVGQDGENFSGKPDGVESEQGREKIELEARKIFRNILDEEVRDRLEEQGIVLTSVPQNFFEEIFRQVSDVHQEEVNNILESIVREKEKKPNEKILVPDPIKDDIGMFLEKRRGNIFQNALDEYGENLKKKTVKSWEIFKFPKAVLDNLEGVSPGEISKYGKEIREFLIEKGLAKKTEPEILKAAIEFLELKPEDEVAREIAFQMRSLLEADFGDFSKKKELEEIAEELEKIRQEKLTIIEESEKRLDVSDFLLRVEDLETAKGKKIVFFNEISSEVNELVEKINREIVVAIERKNEELDKMEKPVKLKDVEEKEESPRKEIDPNQLAKLEEEVRTARQRFVKEEALVYKNISLISRVLGRGSVEALKVDSVKRFSEKYQKSLKDLLDYKLEELRLKEGELTGEKATNEFSNIKKYLQTFSAIELQDEMYLAKKAVKKGRIEENLAEISSRAVKFGRWYKKLPLKYKLAVGVTFLGGGLALTLTGSAALGGIALGLDMARRSLGAFSAGLGAHDLSQKGLDWKEQRKEKKATKKLAKEIEISEWDKYSLVDEFLNKEIQGASKKIIAIRKKERLAKSIGLGVGALAVGMGALKYLEKSGFSLSGNGQGKSFGGKLPLNNTSDNNGFSPAEKPITPAPQPEVENAPAPQPEVENAPAPQPEVENAPAPSQLLEVNKGDAVTGLLNQKGISGKEAYRMVLNYAKEQGINPKELDTIYPGQKIVLSPDGSKIVDILESHDSHIMKSIRSISGENNSVWRSVKNLKFDEIDKPRINKNLVEVMNKYQEILGEKANPLPGEKVSHWVARMAELSMSKK